jgi:Na+/H+ antiporter NhaD/arsenite permease-like protein
MISLEGMKLNLLARYLSEGDDGGGGGGGGGGSHSPSLSFDIIAVIIFIIVSLCFFFPCNRFIPLDRRSAAIMGATLCYASRSFVFPNNKIDIVEAIDFDVLALLTGIMAINFIMIHQKESKRVIRYVQTQVKDHPKSGFWLVSFAAFIISPFLTNDGVCLLFVEPILNAFESLTPQSTKHSDFPLTKADSFYFLLALACSSNIGSALTYTGNPQVIYSYFPLTLPEHDRWRRLHRGDVSPLILVLYGSSVDFRLSSHNALDSKMLDEMASQSIRNRAVKFAFFSPDKCPSTKKFHR